MDLDRTSTVADRVPVVILTHHSRQGDMETALKELAKLDVVREEPVCIHVVTPPNDEQ